ncbi:hypothetical protein D9613_006786 [Agrocybe pediades]|uniref:Uncharacterized protein n=1 Tax=Agrocybe pediades TaxID=84607 RepID=A0A8H4QHU9_9AGAR|nr:hypothetical protein D9613_006786 [Agrocybe pediades]
MSTYDNTLSTNAPDNLTLTKFPHTRAQLAALARQYKPPLDNESGNAGSDQVEQRLVNQVVSLLSEEREDEMKRLLQDVYGLEDDTVEHVVLELMHKHRDDVAGVPFLFLTPTRRPISRPSSRASSTSRLRPETPISAPTSPLANLFRKPTMSEHSPSSSPVLSHSVTSSAFVAQSQFTASLPASPLSSPRLLNAKANEFRPIPRPLSAAATHPHFPSSYTSSSNNSYTTSSLLGLRADTPSPDMWATRASSNLAIAAPLVAETTVSHGTPLRSSHRPKDLYDEEDDPFDPFSSNINGKKGNGSNGNADSNPIPSFHAITVSDFDSTRSWSGSPLAGGVGSGADSANDNEHSGEDSQIQEQTQPFPLSFYPSDSDLDFPNVNSTSYFDEFDANDDPTAGFANNYNSNYSMNTISSSSSNNHNALGDPTSADETLMDGMTPFDVLTSIFGSTIAPSELEDALAANGYDFERAMGWLVDSRAGAAPGGATSTINAQQGQQGPVGPGRMQPMGARVTLVGRGGAAGGIPGRGGMPNAMMGGPGGMGLGGARQQGQQQQAPRYANGRAVPGANRVCRYFVAGECLRADCRFSHDLERALCRFWLRGTCAKQENCEFLHHLPKDVDMASLNAVLARANVQPGTGPLAAFMGAGPYNNGMGMMGTQQQQQMQQDEFPALRYDGANDSGVGGVGRGKKFASYVNDPSRTRFAAAVKKPAPPPHHQLGDDTAGNGTAPRNVLGSAADNLYHPSAVVAPRASPRISLRSPLLLPTLPTGGSLSTLYMSYRSRALHLGSMRNTCLSRAAEAWRRGDGASAKRFSKEGQAMNERMREEMREAAAGLVRERVKVAEGAVRGRDAGWSDDPGDRGARGRVMGAGLGVCLGVVGRSQLSSAATSSGSLSFFVPASGTSGGGKELTQEERTEAMVDLHGLHSNEATEVLEKFLLGLEQEHFYGLAFVIVGEEKHTGTSQEAVRGGAAPVRGGRLAMAVKEWLHRWGYPWHDRDGVICVDPLTHLSA